MYEASNDTEATVPPVPETNDDEDDEDSLFKPVLILIALRLGIDSLHPTYQPCFESLFRITLFCGIAGGRPNSSLYFIGTQGDDLFY